MRPHFGPMAGGSVLFIDGSGLEAIVEVKIGTMDTNFTVMYVNVCKNCICTLKT